MQYKLIWMIWIYISDLGNKYHHWRFSEVFG